MLLYRRKPCPVNGVFSRKSVSSFRGVAKKACPKTGKTKRESVHFYGYSLKRIKQANKTSEQNKRTKQANKTGEHKANILAYLQEQQPAGASDISAVLGLSDSRTRAILKELTEDGIILAEGKTNTRVYRIK